MFRLRLLIALILGVCVLGAAHAQPRTAARHKVVVVVANRLVLSDLQDPSYRSIDSLYQQSSVGLISPNCQGWKNEWSVMLTAGSGTSCRGGAFIGSCLNVNEIVAQENRRAGDVYASRTGRQVMDGSAVFLNLGLAEKANAELNRPIRVGALGDALHEAGLRTCAVGNADFGPRYLDRSPAVMAMDSFGTIDLGLLSTPRVKQGCGICSDVSVLLNAAEKGMREADLIVVNFGDTTRLDESRKVISDSAYTSHRAEIMNSLDRLVQGLLKSLAPRDKLVLVSFSPPSGDTWNQLTPLLIYSRASHNAVLYSSTTRTSGLIAASDFAPTMLSLLDLGRSNEMLGRAAVPISGAVDLNELDKRVVTHRTLWRPILWVFGVLGIVSFTCAALLSAFRPRMPAWTPKAIRLAMLAGSTGPLAMLLAVLAPVGVVGHTAGVFGCVIVFTLIGMAFGFWNPGVITARPIRVIFALTVIAVLADACTNGSLARFSLPGACQITGFRYYGIGNEYAGILISMGAVLALFSDKRKWLVPVLGVLFVIALGSGRLGANYGATIAATLSFGLITVAVWRGGFGARHVIGFTLLSCMLVLLLAYIDSRVFGVAGSHAGRATSLAEQIGPGYILDIVGRKILINLGLAKMQHVRAIFFAFTPFLVLWFYFIQGRVKHMLAGTPIFAGLKGILIGAVGALLFNDSGVVFATIMVVMMVLVLLYSLLECSERPGTIEPAEREGTIRV